MYEELLKHQLEHFVIIVAVCKQLPYTQFLISLVGREPARNIVREVVVQSNMPTIQTGEQSSGSFGRIVNRRGVRHFSKVFQSQSSQTTSPLCLHKKRF